MTNNAAVLNLSFTLHSGLACSGAAVGQTLYVHSDVTSESVRLSFPLAGCKSLTLLDASIVWYQTLLCNYLRCNALSQAKAGCWSLIQNVGRAAWGPLPRLEPTSPRVDCIVKVFEIPSLSSLRGNKMWLVPKAEPCGLSVGLWVSGCPAPLQVDQLHPLAVRMGPSGFVL